MLEKLSMDRKNYKHVSQGLWESSTRTLEPASRGSHSLYHALLGIGLCCVLKFCSHEVLWLSGGKGIGLKQRWDPSWSLGQEEVMDKYST